MVHALWFFLTFSKIFLALAKSYFSPSLMYLINALSPLSRVRSLASPDFSQSKTTQCLNCFSTSCDHMRSAGCKPPCCYGYRLSCWNKENENQLNTRRMRSWKQLSLYEFIQIRKWLNTRLLTEVLCRFKITPHFSMTTFWWFYFTFSSLGPVLT